MADRYGKRSRDPSDDGDRPIKREHQNSNQSSKVVEDFLESMDPSVRIKLRSMFDDGLLMYSDLDERNITELSKFDASVALETLEHYCSGDLSQVRNRRAYLAGAIRRRQHMVRDNYDAPPLAPDGLPLLVPPVQRKFDDIKQMNPKVAELDQRSLDALAALPPSRALMALDRFGSMDFSLVRNPSALFMSIVRNVMEAEDDRDGHWGGRERDWGPPPGGEYRDRRGPPPIYGAPAPPPPPPPRRPQPASQYAAAPGGLPPGTIIAPGLNGGLVIAGTAGTAALAGGIAGLSGLQAALAAPAAAAAPGLVLTAAPTAAGGVPQYMLVSTSSAQGVQAAAGQQQVLAVPGSAAVLSTQQGLGVQQPAAAAAAAAEAAVPAGVPQEWAAGRKNYGAEQGQLGVRVAEFHDLSPFAVYVNPSPALKLQSLWDSGNELVSMLDDKVWQVLAEMPAPEALAAIQEAADALDNPQSQIRNINAYFMSAVKKVWAAGMAHRNPGSGPGSGDHHHAQQRGPPREGYGAGRGSGGGFGRGGGGAGAAGGGGDHWGAAGAGPAAGGGDKPQFSREPAIHLLPPEQRLLAEQLCQRFAPMLREEHFDEGVIACLARLSHEEGVAVLKELGQNSMTAVRNMPGYIMGIAKRYFSGQRGAGHRQ